MVSPNDKIMLQTFLQVYFSKDWNIREEICIEKTIYMLINKIKIETYYFKSRNIYKNKKAVRLRIKIVGKPYTSLFG